jgi:putative CocE/NonD family hydrolase
MSDGTVLRADVQLPAGRPGPFPVALTITGYGKSSPISSLGGGAPSGLVRRGYAAVVVDDRGTGASGGTWDSWGPRTQADYREVLDWIVDQPWSDGRIGVTGGSYMGITSLYAAASGHPAVKAVFATVPMADGYRDIVLGGGQVNTAFIPLWMGLVTGLGLASAGTPETMAEHLLGVGQFQLPTLAQTALGGATAYDGPFWRQRSPIEVVDRISAPTFLVGGLDDIFQRGTPMLYERLADNADTRLLLGPWTHTTTGSGLPRDGVPSLDALLLQWFDQHVLGLDAKAACIPPVTQFVRGHERYERSTTWPVPGLSAQRWHLRSTGGLTRGAPGSSEGSRAYLGLPVTGACTRSTSQWLVGLIGDTGCAQDNRIDEAIGSLTYTSPPLEDELVINGPIQADVWVTTTGGAATVSVAVSAVAPDGTSRGLTNGLLTAEHRAVDPSRSRHLDGQSIQPWHPFTQEAALPVVAGRPMLLPIELFPTSAVLAPGHRLRITIAPFDVPHALPALPGSLGSIGGLTRVLSDAAHPSSVVLPVRP